jgi:hypothetical protein
MVHTFSFDSVAWLLRRSYSRFCWTTALGVLSGKPLHFAEMKQLIQ